MKARTVREWLHNGVAPNTRPRRKYRSAFDLYAPYVLKRWQEGEHSGRQLWREVRFQGYSGSERMVYRFLETLKTTEIVTSAGSHRLPQYTSNAAVWLFMRRIDAFGRAPTRRSGGFSSGTYVSQHHVSARPELSSDDAASARSAPGCLAHPGSRERASRTSEFCLWCRAG